MWDLCREKKKRSRKSYIFRCIIESVDSSFPLLMRGHCVCRVVVTAVFVNPVAAADFIVALDSLLHSLLHASHSS